MVELLLEVVRVQLVRLLARGEPGKVHAEPLQADLAGDHPQMDLRARVERVVHLKLG
jgi:hypothetical protein